MGDRMTPMPFPQLVEWVMKEHDDKGTVFGVYRPYQAKAENDRKIYEPEIVLVSDASFLTREIDIGAGISGNAVLVLNTGDEGIAGQFKEKFGFKEVYYADATRIAVKNIKRNIPNSAMLGVLARTGIVKIESVMAAVKSTFGTKAGSANADAAKEAYDETGKI